MGMDMEEEIRDIDKFRLFCHRDSKLYHGRNERIIRYHELSWYKGLAGLFAMILFAPTDAPPSSTSGTLTGTQTRSQTTHIRSNKSKLKTTRSVLKIIYIVLKIMIDI